jgi:hypothetical protein
MDLCGFLDHGVQIADDAGVWHTPQDHTVVVDAPLPHGFIHFVWPFLTPKE